MTLKDLFNTFEFANRVRLICYLPYIELEDVVDKKDIPKDFEPYLNYKVIEIDLETYVSGQCCGIDIETPYLEITIKG